MSCTYLRTFFAEKDLDSQVYEVTAKGGTCNLFCTEDVIDALLNASEPVQAQAADINRRIDFANGNVHGFLKHCASGMAFDLGDMA
jgi:hypothetical protein